MTVPLILETERLRLEPVGPEHAEGLWRATQASIRELRSWLTWANGPTMEATRTFAERSPALWREGREHPFVVVEDGEIVGAVALHVPYPQRGMGELGYWVRTDRAGRGVCTEAARAAVEFGFEAIGLYRIELRAGVENLASQRVAEKLGFKREGLLREAGWVAAGYQDMHLFGLLASERAWI